MRVIRDIGAQSIPLGAHRGQRDLGLEKLRESTLEYIHLHGGMVTYALWC